MRNVIILLILCAGLAGSFSRVQAQVSDYYEEPRMYIGSVNPSGEFMEVNYDINTAGYVELHLIDSKGQKLWIKGQLRSKKGQYTFKIPLEPMAKNEKYDVLIKFKGKEEKSYFYTPS
ncbi:MAG: hypothetical protein K1X92_04105 [Bacteroidia bacterium]|nr:hypothetical protein [Bacteroidia bacterium]